MVVPSASSKQYVRSLYISKDGRRQLPDYRSSGSDNSYMYIYVCSPLAEALVQHCVPLWMAPNLISLLGLGASCLHYLLVHAHSPSLTEPCPGWVWLVGSLCLLAYQTLDNMDGKQARRTGSSSPLGVFVDHGADAVNSVLLAMNTMAYGQMGARKWECLCCWGSLSTMFFCATWEHYFTGTLAFGAFNGPTDGVLMLAALYMFTFYEFYGDTTELLHSELVWGDLSLGMSRAQAILWFCVIWALGTALVSARAVFLAVGGSSRRFLAALSLAGPFGLHLAGYAFCMVSSRCAEADARTVNWFFGLFFLILVRLGPVSFKSPIRGARGCT